MPAFARRIGIVLQHLVLAGPLTVGEMAAHLDRSQSVVSDIVTHLTKAYMATMPAWRDHPTVRA